MSADFDAVYAAHRTQVLDHCIRLVGETEGPDLAQRVWVKVWRNLDGFRGDSAMSSWLFRVTRNAAADHGRRQRMKKRDRFREIPIDAALGVPALDPWPDAAVLQAQRRTWLRAQLDRLPAEYLAACLGWFDGLSIKEMSAALGVPAGTVKSRKHRSLLLLKSAVARPWTRQPFVRKSADSVRAS